MRVFVTRRLPDDLLEPVRRLAKVEVWEGEGPVPTGLLGGEVRTCDGLLSMLTDDIGAAMIEEASRLVVISQMAVGVDNIDLAACRAKGIAVGHTPDVLTETVADTAFALLAAVVRRLPEGTALVRAGEWGPWDPWFMLGGDLHGTTMGIVGMGRIGRAVATRAAGFAMDLLYSSPSPKEIEGARVGLAELLGRSDHVVLTVPLTAETRGMIGREQLRAMRPGAVLVNVSRGPIVDTSALVEALQAGWIAGAGLDVTDPEPLPPDHPLLGQPNCLVVPHIGSASTRTRRAMAELAVRNLVAGLRGEPLPHAAAG